MTEAIKVLDHGLVRLVSFMQPMPELLAEHDQDRNVVEEHLVQPANWTGDLEVVRNARVSYDADWRAGEDEGKDAKLIDYLVRNRHTSPLEAMTFTFEVKAPLFVIRQWQRHRTWSYSEVSARYTALPEEFYVPQVDQITTQSDTNKQMRTTEQHPDAQGCQNMIRNACKMSFSLYKDLLAEGVPRELARGVLPLNTYTHMFATVDLHNLFHFLKLRLHPHAQYEIRVYAEALLQLIEPIVPVAGAAFRKHILEA